MSLPEFDIPDVCEKCKKKTFVSAQGICRRCLTALLETKKQPETRLQAMKEIRRRENQMFWSVRMHLYKSTKQKPGRFKGDEK